MAEELISALSRVKGLAGGLAHLGVPVQGHADRRPRDRRAARRADRARRQRAARPATGCASARSSSTSSDGYHIWSERFDRTIDDVFADPGRDRAIDHRVAARHADPAGDRHDGQAGDVEPRRLPPLPARPVPAQQVRRPVRLADRRAQVLRAGGRARSDVFGGLRRPGGGLQRARLHDVPAGAGSQQGGARSGASARSRSTRRCPKATPRSAGPRRCLPSTCATAERDFQRALEIAPGYAPAHGYYALLLCGFGRFDEAHRSRRRRRGITIRCG